MQVLRYAALAALLTLPAAHAQTPPDAIGGTVELAPALAAQVKPGGTLFVYIRRVKQDSGPPIAVISIDNPKYPQTFQLKPENQMVPATPVKPFTGRYRVYARHSPTGRPMVNEGFLGTTLGAGDAGVAPGATVRVVVDKALP